MEVSWTNVTANIPDLPKWGNIANIEIPRYQKERHISTVDLHQMGEF